MIIAYLDNHYHTE